MKRTNGLIPQIRLPWQATDNHPVLQALHLLRDLYAHEQRDLPLGTRIFLGRVWQKDLTGPDRERAFCAFEVATLLALRRAIRNGTLWIDHSLAFRSRERLFIPADRWQAQRRPYFRRLGLPHVRDRWGIFHAQPLIINDQRQAGAAIEGIIRQEEIEITQLAVDTHRFRDGTREAPRL